jgi:hypothetical protein
MRGVYHNAKPIIINLNKVAKVNTPTWECEEHIYEVKTI